MPAQECTSVVSDADDETWGTLQGCEVPEAGFAGHWIQPAHSADGYAGLGNARFGKGDEIHVSCNSLAALTLGEPFPLTIEAGAAALTAGAAIVAAAMAY